MHFPKKRFGQHFLNDEHIIYRIVKFLSPKASDHLVEIGPGQGALTIPVLKESKVLEVIELDRDLIDQLAKRCETIGSLIIHTGDVLKFDFNTIKSDERLLRIFGNLPYNISTPLIFHLLTFSSIISDMFFMLQKEVAERIAAKPNHKIFGRLSVMVQYHCHVDYLFEVPPGAFRPPPQVKSAVLRLSPFKELPYRANNYAVFASIVRDAFNHRRKTIRNSLKDRVDPDLWSEINIHSDARPEDLSVQDFVAISNAINEKG